MTRRFMPVALEKYSANEGGVYSPWPYESKHGPTKRDLSFHFIFTKDVFFNVMAPYMVQRGIIASDDVEAYDYLQNIGEQLEEGGVEVLNEAPRRILSEVAAAFNDGRSVRLAVESQWRYMGRNILEVDSLLMDALMRTQVNVLPEDFQLPISPLYLALPEGTLSVESQYEPGVQVNVDGIMVQLLDYEKMPGDVLTFHEVADHMASEEGISPYDARNALLGKGLNVPDSVYVDDYGYVLGDVALRGGYTRQLRVIAYTSPRAGESLSDSQFIYFIIPLDAPFSIEDFIKAYDQNLLDLLTNSGTTQTPEEWGRAIFNPLLYFFSQGADKERESGLTAGQEKRLSKISSKKQRQKFIEKHKSPYSVIKIGKSFSSSVASGIKRGAIDKRFVVRGHWRVQRVGKGLKDVKTIWIQPYVKGRGEKQTTPRVYRNPL